MGKKREILRRLFGSQIAIDRGWSNYSREEALDVRKSRERRDKIYADRQKNAQILDQKQPFSMGIFHFLAAENPTSFGGGGGGENFQIG